MIAGEQFAAGAGSSAGPLGLIVIVLLAVATVLLIRNMDKRLRRLPRDFEAQQPGPDRPADLPGPRRGPDDPA